MPFACWLKGESQPKNLRTAWDALVGVTIKIGSALISKAKSDSCSAAELKRPLSSKRLDFWRRLEQNFRKQRYRWTCKLLFDPDWYRKVHADPSGWEGDPWDHYMEYGKYEGRGLNKILNLVTTRDCTRRNIKSYSRWIKKYDQFTPKIRRDMKKKVAALNRKPLLSVIMPVYNTNPKWLIQAIESVRNQIYPHWELCIADDCSTDQRIRGILEKYARMDPRLKVIFRDTNGHIASASNSALALAKGDFIALFDHDDKLPEHALYWVAETINRNPEARLLYSDWDTLDENGVRLPGYFKPDFNYELFLAQNCVSQLGVYFRELVCELGGFRKGYEGSQDWDLALRVVAAIPRNQIVHIPRILYHWRQHSQSVSKASSEKCWEAGRRAVKDHLQSVGGGSVEAAPGCSGFHRIKFPLPTALPLVSFIICTRDRVELLRKAIDSIHSVSTYTNYEIVIVDNGSRDSEAVAYLASLAKRPGVRVIRDESPFNFSRLSNTGVAQSRGEVVCLLNNDIEVITPDWIEEMLSFAIKPDVGAVGARLWYPDGKLQHGGVIIGIGGVAGHFHLRLPKGNKGYFGRAALQQELSAVTGACLMVRRGVFQEVGGLDEKLEVAFNDIDFCLRLRAAGYRNIWTPFAELMHHESASRGYEDNPEKIARYQREMDFMRMRWGKTLEQDPFHNPNL
jgi:glycosyltransferase involved in cell wall biosynthesis